jgi:lipopolysaccharide export LptBFGC system permease protein LptF
MTYDPLAFGIWRTTYPLQPSNPQKPPSLSFPLYTLAVLQRYLLRETLGMYVPGVLLFVFLLTTDFLTSYSGVFLRQDTKALDIFKMWAYQLPYFLEIAITFGLVVALLLVLARWVRQSELKAAFASGVAPRTLLWPMLGIGAAASLAVLLNGGWLKPISQGLFENLQYRIYYGSDAPSGVLNDQVYAPAGHGVFFASRIYPQEAQVRLEGIRVVEPGGSVWSADSGIWGEGVWQLKQATRVDPGGKVFKEDLHPISFPAGFRPRTSSNKALTLPELHASARANPSDRFALSRVYANAVAAFLLAWVAGVIGLGLREQAWAFISAFLLLFGYYVVWTLSQRFAQYDVLGAYGAWLPNLIYLIIAVAATARLR